MTANDVEKKKCNWCYKEFLEDRIDLERKPYCCTCQKRCYRECARCHKPYPDLHLFNRSEKKCDSCMSTMANRAKKIAAKLKEIPKDEDYDDDDIIYSSAGSSLEDASDEEDEKPVEGRKNDVGKSKDAKIDDVALSKSNTVTDSREKAQDDNQRKMGELMQALTEHQRSGKKAPVEGKPKRKYAKREPKGQEKIAELELDFLKSFLALRKVERASGAKPHLTSLVFY